MAEGPSGRSCGNLHHLRCKFLAELKEPEKQVSDGSVWRAVAVAAAEAARLLNDNTGGIESRSLDSRGLVSVQGDTERGFCFSGCDGKHTAAS